jgi:inner membrane protein
MNPITHVLTGWCLAEAVPKLSRREQVLVTLAAAAPDLDGLGVIAELSTEHSARPLLWWTEYHHVLGHNLLFACIATMAAALLARKSRALTAALVFLAIHLHILGDLAGSRGPDEYQWPILYLYPFSDPPLLTWSGQWYLNAWPNIALTAALIAATITLAWRRGYSIVGLVSRHGDAVFVEILRARLGTPVIRTSGNRTAQ